MSHDKVIDYFCITYTENLSPSPSVVLSVSLHHPLHFLLLSSHLLSPTPLFPSYFLFPFTKLYLHVCHPSWQCGIGLYGPFGKQQFPHDSVEAVLPVLARRKRMTRSDLQTCDPWRLLMSLRLVVAEQVGMIWWSKVGLDGLDFELIYCMLCKSSDMMLGVLVQTCLYIGTYSDMALFFCTPSWCWKSA